jgi:hypothetical protein
LFKDLWTDVFDFETIKEVLVRLPHVSKV